MLSVRLFHGRNSPDEPMSGWGFDGPTLGPFTHVSMTYGCINVSDEHDRDFDLVMVDGLVVYGGKYYGQMSVTAAEAPMERVDERLLQAPARLLVKREERSPVRIPAKRFRAYREIIEIFADAIRERVGDAAANSILTALSNVVARREKRT
ncbi:MAG: hypothetical protein ACO1OB_22700 [Archangium sp.]